MTIQMVAARSAARFFHMVLLPYLKTARLSDAPPDWERIAAGLWVRSWPQASAKPLGPGLAEAPSWQVRTPKDHINIRILPTMISGIPLVLGPRTRM